MTRYSQPDSLTKSSLWINQDRKFEYKIIDWSPSVLAISGFKLHQIERQNWLYRYHLKRYLDTK